MPANSRKSPKPKPSTGPAVTRRPRVAYRTRRGVAYVGDSMLLLERLKPKSVQLVVTSPPFALTRKKAYGNQSADQYADWLHPFLRLIHRALRDDGSLVLDLGGSWVPGEPTRNVYQYEVLLRAVRDKEAPFHLAQDLFWLNRARLPGPIQWVNIERIRLTDAVNVVWWLSKTPRPYADNRAVLRSYSPSMLKLFEEGYNSGGRPSEWKIGATSFANKNGGSIPSSYLNVDPEVEYGYPTNLLAGSNTASRDPYLTACREFGFTAHPARFPIQFAEFFVAFLSRRDDAVLDPFAGSNTTGWAAERLGRKWISCDLGAEYIAASAARLGVSVEDVSRKLGLSLAARHAPAKGAVTAGQVFRKAPRSRRAALTC